MDMIYLLTRKCLIICLLLLHLHFVASQFRILGLFPINATTAEESTNLRLTINNLQQQYLPNASIDIHTYNKTNKDGTAMQIMLDSFVQPSNLTAIIGPGRKKVINNVNWFLSTIPEKVLQIVYNPVINDDNKEYLHNLAPSVSQVVDVLFDLMVKINWNYIAIMRDSTEFSILSTELLRKKAKIKQICIGLEEEIMRNVEDILKNIKSADIKGILVFGKRDTVREVSRNSDKTNFQFIFVSNENLLSKDTQQELPNHSLQVMWNGFVNEINSNGNLKYINDAVIMALKWFSICRNFSNCRDLQQDEIINGTVNIYQKVNDNQIQVDIYKKEPNIKIEKSFCRTKCENCVLNIIPNPYTLKNGNYSIVLVVPIHAKESDPFTCSQSLNYERIVNLVEAARFAIQTSIDPDLGLIIIDSCSQPIITTEKLLRINYTNVLGVIGGYYSRNTIPAAEVLSSLQKPLITYGAESHVLSDRSRFPYVHRTITSTEEKSKAIILLCKKMEWKAINIMYNKESFGISGQSLLLKYAKIHGICIANSFEIELGETSFQIFLNRLRDTSTVKIVVIFFLPESYKKWSTVLEADQEDNEFLFIDAYGHDKETRKLQEKHYKNHLILEVNKLPNQAFLDYYTNLTESEFVKNPWAKGTIEISNKCRFEDSFNIAYETTCVYQLKVDSVSKYYNLAIKSVYALINGTVCIVKGTCSDVKAETISENISKTKLNISGKEQRLFDDAGNSRFHIYSLLRVKNLKSFEYDKVASYENGTWEINRWNVLSIFTSICDDSCEDCPKETESVFIAFITLDVILSLIIITIAGIFLWKKRNDLRS